jgi:hypothetical protein
VILAALAIVYSSWPLWRAMFPLEIDADDIWNAFQADAAFGPGALYPPIGALIANNYPPLSFYLIGLIAKLGIDAVYVGRALSIGATAVSALSVGLCIRQLGGNARCATLGALWFLATLTRFFDTYVGKNDPHLMALAMTTAALAWFLARQARGRGVEPAVLLMVVAGFYKHTLIATPVTALLWLATINRRLALRAATIGGTTAIAGLALCYATYGRDFIDQLLFPRYYSLTRALAMLGHTQWVLAALFIWAVWAWSSARSPAKRFTIIYLGVAFLIFAITSTGDGVGDNSQFEFVAAAAISLGLAFDGAGAFLMQFHMARTHAVLLALLIIRLLASERMEPYLVLGSSDYRMLFPAAVGVMEREIARIKAIPGPVDCTVPTVCRRAGKTFVVDIFAITNRIKTGRMTEVQFAAQLQARTALVDRRATIDPLLRRF